MWMSAQAAKGAVSSKRYQYVRRPAQTACYIVSDTISEEDRRGSPTGRTNWVTITMLGGLRKIGFAEAEVDEWLAAVERTFPAIPAFHRQMGEFSSTRIGSAGHVWRAC